MPRRTSRSAASPTSFRGVGVAGLQLEVDLNADLDRLNFVTVVLYTAASRGVGDPVTSDVRGGAQQFAHPRVIPIGMALLALQQTMFVEMKPFGVIMQLLLAFAASAGAAGGPERGAIAASCSG